ncbi:ribonuclease BN [Thiocystis minor]|nr:ribonuclease BN [Thiocystis minor]
MNQRQTVSERLNALLWDRPAAAPPRWQAGLIWLARLIYALLRDLTKGDLSLQAMGLVYTTLLSLVPLLAVSFSVLKGFGVHNQLEPFLLSALEPLGESGVEIVGRIIGFVDNMQVGVLGSVGLATLMFTVISLIQKIEQVFNSTWRVVEQRRFAQRFSLYLSVLLIGPVLFFSAVGLSASLSSHLAGQPLIATPAVTALMETFGQFGPYLMISLNFAFFYMVIPSTRVRLRSALIGALVAGLLWEIVGDLFSAFMVGSTRFMAIYSSLAILMLLMIWIHIGWSILLIGASIAFYHQHPEYLTTRTHDLRLSNRLRERLALMVAGQIAHRYAAGEPAWNCQTLSIVLGVPAANTQKTLTMLEQSGFLLRTADEDPGYVPARAPESIRIVDLLDATRRFEERDSGCPGTVSDAGVQQVEQDIETAIAGALKDMTLKDFAAAP